MDKENILVLEQTGDVKQTFHLEGATQLGRLWSADMWAVENRKVPEIFEKEVKNGTAISFIDDGQVSRNHAGIFLDKNGYHLCDLNSKNGTYLNGEKIEGNGKPLLWENDVIRIGRVCLVVKGTKNQADNYALLVGHDGGNLRGVSNDLEELTRALKQRGYGSRLGINRLYNGEATKKNVLESLDELSCLTIPESHSLFYYSGHGDKNGLCLGGRHISPRRLNKKLKNMRGKKAVILDCCNASIFINRYVPPETLVFAASSKDGNAYEGINGRYGYMGRFYSNTCRLFKRT